MLFPEIENKFKREARMQRLALLWKIFSTVMTLTAQVFFTALGMIVGQHIYNHFFK